MERQNILMDKRLEAAVAGIAAYLANKKGDGWSAFDSTASDDAIRVHYQRIEQAIGHFNVSASVAELGYQKRVQYHPGEGIALTDLGGHTPVVPWSQESGESLHRHAPLLKKLVEVLETDQKRQNAVHMKSAANARKSGLDVPLHGLPKVEVVEPQPNFAAENEVRGRNPVTQESDEEDEMPSVAPEPEPLVVEPPPEPAIEYPPPVPEHETVSEVERQADDDPQEESSPPPDDVQAIEEVLSTPEPPAKKTRKSRKAKK